MVGVEYLDKVLEVAKSLTRYINRDSYTLLFANTQSIQYDFRDV